MNRTHRILPSLAAAFTLAALVASCVLTDKPADEGTTDVVGPDPKLAEVAVAPELVSANTRFAFDIHSTLAESAPDSNLFISPVSISLALTLTYNGADGTTREQMGDVLHVDGVDLDELSRDNAILLSNLMYGDEDVTLEIANSLWAKQGITFYDEFMDRNRDYYSAEVFPITTAGAINNWVSDKTHEKIEKVVDEVDPNMLLFLINAIYLNATWTTEFDETETEDEPFMSLDGTQPDVPLMRQHGTYRYLETEAFQAVSLPYGDGRFGMYVFLPASNSSLAEFQTELTVDNWTRWMSEFGNMQGTIRLPGFELKYEKQLKDVLCAMGMPVAFNPTNADFRNMLPLPQGAYVNAFIDFVLHKSYVKVDEEGTEAAAVTVIGMAGTVSLDPNRPPTFYMRVDRPFFFAIVDNVSDTILFMGSIVDPLGK